MKRHQVVVAIAVILIAIVIIGGESIIWIVSFHEETSPGLMNVVGTVESGSSNPITLMTRRLSVESEPEPLGLAYKQGISWERLGYGRVSRIAFIGNFPGRWVRIYNSTGAQVENFTTEYLSISFDGCNHMAIIDSVFSAVLSTEGHLVELIEFTKEEVKIRSTAGYTDLFSSFEIEATSGRESSQLTLNCDGLNVTSEGRQIVLDETVIVNIDSFGPVRVDLVFGQTETIRLWGNAQLSLSKGNALWRDVRIAFSSVSGGITHRGSVDILGFEHLTITTPPQSEDFPSDGFKYTFDLSGQMLRILLLKESGPEPLSPVTHRTYNVPDDSQRQFLAILVPILLGVSFSYIVDWFRDEWRNLRVPEFRPRKSIRRLRQVMALAIVAIVVSSLLFVTSLPGLVKNQPILYYHSEYPVRLNVVAEETVDLDSLQGTYEIVIPLLRSLLGNEDVSAEFSTYPDDGVDSYDFNTSETYLPVKRQSWNRGDIMASNRVDIYMLHHDGHSSEFRAFNNGALNVFVGDHDMNPLETVRTIFHELGHGWGVRHNPCSPIMHEHDNRLTPSKIPPSSSLYPGVMIDGVDIYSQAVNQSIIPPPSMGSEISVSLNNTAYESENRRTMRDVYLFMSEDNATFTQIIRTRSIDLIGSDHWDIVELSSARAESYLRGWTPSELWYLAASISGRWVEHPRPSMEC